MINIPMLETIPVFSKETAKLFYINLNLCPLPGKRFLVKEPYVVGSITIPKGFVSNGANIPRYLWSAIPPNDPQNLPFVILHDYLCMHAETTADFKLANRYMHNFAMGLQRKPLVVKSMYYGVCAYTRGVRPIFQKLHLYKQDKMKAFVKKKR